MSFRILTKRFPPPPPPSYAPLSKNGDPVYPQILRPQYLWSRMS